MISAWELYLWTRLDAFGVGFGICTFIFVIASIVISIINISNCAGDCSDWADMDDDDKPRFPKELAMKRSIQKANKAVIWTAVIMILLSFGMPSKKDAAMIWVVPQLATVENADLLKGEAAEIYTLAKEALKESIGVKDKPAE